MLNADVRQVMTQLQELGELRQADGVDWNLELGTLTELMALRDGPALLFDRIKGYPEGYRVLVNLMNSPRRIALMLGLSGDTGGIELVRVIRERFSAITFIDPVEVKDAAFFEESHTGPSVNLFEFPSPLWHEHDGGRYIGTACAVVTRDPDAGWVNAGTYRVQVHDGRTLGVFIERSHHAAQIMRRYWEAGESCPMAVCIGIQPALLLGSFLAVPWGVSEYQWAGGLTGEPLEIVTCETTGLPVPASAEIILEGYSPPPSEESRVEGPFGETTGYYAAGATDQPVIRVEAVHHRKSPVLVGSPPMRPPASSSASYLFRAATIWSEIERAGIPDVRGVWMMPAGSSTFLAVISIKQRYGGHAKQVAQAAMSGKSGGGNLGRFVIVVDEDIDPSDVNQVLWALATRCDPETAIDVIKNCTSGHLDPCIAPDKRAAGNYTSSRAILDACRPFYWKGQFPQTVGTSPELQAQALRDWRHLFT